MAIDRAEAIGLSATVGGHGLILAALYFGIFGMEEKIEKPAALSVTLEGEGSPLPVTGELGEASAAPEFVEEAESELEAAADEADDTADAAAKAEAEAARAAAAAKSANATAEEKRAAREAAAKAARKRREAEAARKKREKAERDRKRQAAKEAEEHRRRMEEQFGGDDSGSSLKVKKNIEISIRSKVQPYWQGCKFSGLEVEKLVTVATFKLTSAGRIVGTPKITTKPSTITPSNKSKVTRHQFCAKQSLLKAQPFAIPSGANVSSITFEHEFQKRRK